MKNLAEIKERLKEELPEQGINHVIKSLQNLIPENSPKYEALLELIKDYDELKIQIISGLSVEKKMEGEASISARLFELINLIEESDFDPNIQKSNLSEDNTIKKGHLLYKVPQKMQLGKESRCLVRISFDKATLVKNLEIDTDTQVRADIRISDYMKVVIDSSLNPDAFEVRMVNENAVQLIDKDDNTEWHYFVKPLQMGEHTLAIKVSLMLEVDGKVRVRERIIEESIVIVTEEVKEEPQEKQLDEDLLLAQGAVMVPSKGQGSKGSSSNSRKIVSPQIAKTFAMGLIFVMASSGIYYMAAPQEADWYIAKWQNSLESYEKYADKYEGDENPHLVTAKEKIEELTKEVKPVEDPTSLPLDTLENKKDTTKTEEPTPPDNSDEENTTEDPDQENPDDVTIENPPPPNPEPPTKVEDPRDRKIYKIAKIKGRVWITENFKYKTPGSWCFGDNTNNCEQLGRLYTWEEAKTVCPKGWHLATKDEWIKLLKNTGGYVDQVDRNNTKVEGDPVSSYETLISGGNSNFDAELNGYRTEGGSSQKKGEYGYFWTGSTPSSTSKTAFIVGFAKTADSGKIFIDQYNKKDALSCRCVKDEQ